MNIGPENRLIFRTLLALARKSQLDDRNTPRDFALSRQELRECEESLTVALNTEGKPWNE